MGLAAGDVAVKKKCWKKKMEVKKQHAIEHTRSSQKIEEAKKICLIQDWRLRSSHTPAQDCHSDRERNLQCPGIGLQREANISRVASGGKGWRDRQAYGSTRDARAGSRRHGLVCLSGLEYPSKESHDRATYNSTWYCQRQSSGAPKIHRSWSERQWRIERWWRPRWR